MPADNNNFSHPFGNNGGEKPNLPLDVTSDMWTPISTGAPMPGAVRLKDAQSTVSLSEKAQEAPAKPQKKKRAQKQPENRPVVAKKGAPKKKQKRTAKPKAQPASPRKTALVISRAEKMLQQNEQNRQQRDIIHRQKHAQRSKERFNRRRRNGDSGDDIRRDEVLRKRRKRRVAAVLTVIAVLIVAGAAALIYALVVGAPIAQIVVTGDSVYSQEEIVNASGVMTGENMFRVSERAMNKRICALLPYVGSVDVKYQLPDVLELAVTDTTDKYLISGKSAFLCLSETQKILSLKKKKPQDGQYRLDGFDATEGEVGAVYKPAGDDEKRFNAAKEIIAQLENNGLQKANVLDLSDLSHIVLRYDGRVNFYLGTTDNLAVRLRATAEALEKYVSENTIGYLEISYEGKIFFREGTMVKD